MTLCPQSKEVIFIIIMISPLHTLVFLHPPNLLKEKTWNKRIPAINFTIVAGDVKLIMIEK